MTEAEEQTHPVENEGATESEEDRQTFLSRIGEAWKQSVGNFAAGGGETKTLFARLADFGTLSQNEAIKLIGEAKERIDANKAEIDKRIDASLKKATLRLSVPSEEEIAEFEERLDALDAKVDGLLAQRR